MSLSFLLAIDDMFAMKELFRIAIGGEGLQFLLTEQSDLLLIKD
jgi:hypothetical protein